MTLALAHIKSLCEDLRRNGWYITAFPMNDFIHHDYAVVFEDLRAIDRGSRYYAVELTFIDMADENRILVIRANAYGLAETHLADAYNYFGIHQNGNGNFDPRWLIYRALNTACPESFVGHPENMKRHIINKVNNRDTANGNGRYCFAARHNGLKSDGTPMQRSEFNTAKTKLLRENLYERLGKNDPTISFCYSENESDNKTDAEIIYNFQSI